MEQARLDPQDLLSALERRAGVDPRDRAGSGGEPVRVRWVEERGDRDAVVLRGTVQGREASPHEAVLTVRGDQVETRCDCDSGRWPCHHVVALARAWARHEARPAARGWQTEGWRGVLDALAPRNRGLPTDSREILAHWIDLEECPGGVWGLSLSWRVHRAGARGIGRGKRVGPGFLSDLSHSFVVEEDRAVWRCIGAGHAPEAERPGNRDVRVREERVDPVLRALGRAPWVFWVRSRQPVTIDLRPTPVTLAGTVEDEQLELQLEWGGRVPTEGESGGRRVLGSLPPWVEAGGVLSPVLGVQDGRALAFAARSRIEVPKEELPAFLGSSVPDLEARGVGVEIRGLCEQGLLVRELPTPRLYLSEEEGTLVGTLRFAYGDYEIPAERPDPVVGVGPGGVQTYVRRDMDTEFRATQRLTDLQFRMVEPGRFEIRGDAAYDFLRTEIDGLAAEWEVFGRSGLKRYRVTHSPVSLRVRLGADMDWLDVGIEAEVPDDVVPPEEVLWALRKGERYVRLGSGAHALLPSTWLERTGAALHELGLETGEARLPLYMAPLVEEVVEKAPSVAWAGRGAWDRLVSVLRGETKPPKFPVPEALLGTLRPYQTEGYRWLRFMGQLGFGCILADDMGLGKTIQALALLTAEQEREGAGPTLVVAPTSVVPNWEAEARRFSPSLRVLRYHGVDRKDRVEDVAGRDLVITSYAILRRDIRILAAIDWNYAILDEAQAIKNAATQTARAARRLRSRRRLALTGTPLENHLGELWSQFHFLAPGLLGSERHFARAFGRPIAQGDEEAREKLRGRIRPFVLRRLKTQVARDLPEKVESALFCEMEPAQERLYRSLLVASRERVFREVQTRGLARARFSVLEALLRLRQVCCHPAVLPRGLGQGVSSAKFDLFRDFVSEVVEEGHRILVFSQFVSVLGILRSWFEEAGISHLYLDGRTRDREERVRRFQDDDSVRAFLVSLKAGGSGLNLTAADYVILYDPWWNPAVETQAADRAHRIGQTRTVFSYKMITRGTVEEKILALQERKRELTDDLIRAGRAWGTAVTEEDLEELFRL